MNGPSTGVCPTLKSAMARGVTVITYDSDAPTCRSLFVNQTSSQAIGTTEVDLLDDGTIKEFELWDPAKLGYLAAYAAVNLASKKITNASGESFKTGKLGTYTVGSDQSILPGPPQVFDKSNINQFNF